MQQAQRGMDTVESNQLQVRVELQADCLAGVWAHHAEEKWLHRTWRCRSCHADGIRHGRRSAAAAESRLCGARRFHPWLVRTTHALVLGPGCELRHVPGGTALTSTVTAGVSACHPIARFRSGCIRYRSSDLGISIRTSASLSWRAFSLEFLYLVRGRLTRRVAGEPFLARPQELLRPTVVQVLIVPFLAAQFSNAASPRRPFRYAIRSFCPTSADGLQPGGASSYQQPQSNQSEGHRG